MAIWGSIVGGDGHWTLVSGWCWAVASALKWWMAGLWNWWQSEDVQTTPQGASLIWSFSVQKLVQQISTIRKEAGCSWQEKSRVCDGGPPGVGGGGEDKATIKSFVRNHQPLCRPQVYLIVSQRRKGVHHHHHHYDHHHRHHHHHHHLTFQKLQFAVQRSLLLLRIQMLLLLTHV